MKREEYNYITGAGYISLKGDTLEIDKDWLSSVIAEEINEVSGTRLEIVKPVEVNTDIDASFTLCVDANIDRVQYLSIDFDCILITANEDEIHFEFDDLFIKQIISKYDRLVKNS